MNDETLSTAEVAAALDLRRDTVSRRCQEGTIDAEKVGGRWRIPESEVNRIRDLRWERHESVTAKIQPNAG